MMFLFFIFISAAFCFLTSVNADAAWQPYVDENLVGSGHLNKGAIIGHDGSLWAKSNTFNPTQAELKAAVAGFSDPSSRFSTGVYLEGAKYMTLKSDARSWYGKLGTGGAVLVKTGQSILAVLIGIYWSPTQPGNAAYTVESLADYLLENGY